MRPLHPGTDAGALQGEVYALQSEVRRKAEAYEVHEVVRRLDRAEHSLREISTTLAGILDRLHSLEEEKLNGQVK